MLTECLQIRITERLLVALRRRARRLGLRVSDVVRVVLAQAVADEIENDVRQSPPNGDKTAPDLRSLGD